MKKRLSTPPSFMAATIASAHSSAPVSVHHASVPRSCAWIMGHLLLCVQQISYTCPFCPLSLRARVLSQGEGLFSPQSTTLPAGAAASRPHNPQGAHPDWH